jgi:hypothetical protein
MRETRSNSSSCTILAFPIQAEQPKAESPIRWSDDPDRVLARLRAIYGPQWWH